MALVEKNEVMLLKCLLLYQLMTNDSDWPCEERQTQQEKKKIKAKPYRKENALPGFIEAKVRVRAMLRFFCILMLIII